ncbi:complement C1q-like protein 4 [Lingula anatina]|uniref:Complement C1q-like protein 4 n=1 Tax=Lingula anatina TaxID=7574 RepID=A0A1S3I0M8_LINAN|nr:complement C1q-like protein 4 [Lingula anatina]|eukprot:XP_013391381.1 complement C1q-like protein 4 [Lingula anatina]
MCRRMYSVGSSAFGLGIVAWLVVVTTGQDCPPVSCPPSADINQRVNVLAASYSNVALLLERLEREVRQLSTAIGNPDSPRVAFSAALEHSRVVKTSDVLNFEKVITNVGNAYNAMSGRFTCPFSGSYFFTATISTSTTGERIAAELRRSTQPDAFLMYVLAASHDDHNTGSNSVITRCEKGETVHLQAIHVTGPTPTLWYAWSTFSGYLIG